MPKIFEIKPIFIEGYMPENMEEGIIYISWRFKLAIHLCACGCKQKTVTPIQENTDWKLTENDGKVTLRPSIGNFKGESPYHAYYFITDNRVEWL